MRSTVTSHHMARSFSDYHMASSLNLPGRIYLQKSNFFAIYDDLDDRVDQIDLLMDKAFRLS